MLKFRGQYNNFLEPSLGQTDCTAIFKKIQRFLIDKIDLHFGVCCGRLGNFEIILKTTQ